MNMNDDVICLRHMMTSKFPAESCEPSRLLVTLWSLSVSVSVPLAGLSVNHTVRGKSSVQDSHGLYPQQSRAANIGEDLCR